jgi:hypothetical protein
MKVDNLEDTEIKAIIGILLFLIFVGIPIICYLTDL